METCKNCGAPLQEGTKFCGNCGRLAPNHGQARKSSNKAVFIIVGIFVFLVSLCILGGIVFYSFVSEVSRFGSMTSYDEILEEEGTLPNPSEWYGIVNISNYSGPEDISGGYEVWGYIDSDAVGDYFELYAIAPYNSEGANILMSFYIDLYDDTFYPIVNEYSWIYADAPLREEDALFYSPTFEDGILSATYEYDYNGESFTIDYTIEPISDDDTEITEDDVNAQIEDNSPPPDAPIGSATYLGGESLLVTVFLDDKNASSEPWDSAAVDVANQYMDVAVDYMKQEGERYGQEVELYYGEGDLQYFADVNVDMESDDLEELNQPLEAFLEDKVDEEALMEKYDVNSIGYVFLINGPGGSYCLPFEEGDGEQWHREKTCVFLYDIYEPGVFDNPATYAHEIMHMFGAVDLYDEFIYDGVTMDLVEYVEEVYPMEIMYTTYTEEGGYMYDYIPNYISPITAYALGWIDETEEIENFPELIREYDACFEEKMVW